MLQVVLLSIFFPGSGQLYNRQYVKGTLFSILFSAGVYLFFRSYGFLGFPLLLIFPAILIDAVLVYKRKAYSDSPSSFVKVLITGYCVLSFSLHFYMYSSLTQHIWLKNFMYSTSFMTSAEAEQKMSSAKNQAVQLLQESLGYDFVITETELREDFGEEILVVRATAKDDAIWKVVLDLKTPFTEILVDSWSLQGEFANAIWQEPLRKYEEEILGKIFSTDLQVYAEINQNPTSWHMEGEIGENFRTIDSFLMDADSMRIHTMVNVVRSKTHYKKVEQEGHLLDVIQAMRDAGLSSNHNITILFSGAPLPFFEKGFPPSQILSDARIYSAYRFNPKETSPTTSVKIFDLKQAIPNAE